MGLYLKLFRQLTQQPYSSALDTFVAFLAGWTLAWNIGYLGNSTFHVISYSLIPLLLLAPHVLLFRSDDSWEVGAQSNTAVFVERMLLALFVLAGIALTLTLHRPDGDDQHMLSWAFSLVSNPDEAVKAIPGYGSEDRGIAAYDPLRAAFAHVTGTPLLFWYYLVVPAIVGGLAVIANWGVLRELVGRYWPVGMAFFFVVMLAWGDAHRTHANFGFVRFFQGKSGLVSFIVPALLYYFFRYYQSEEKRYYLVMLLLALIAGIGFSRGGVIIGPLVIGLLGLVSLKKSQAKNIAWLGAFLGLLALPLAWFLQDYFGSGVVYTPRGVVKSTTNREMWGFIAGDGFRAYFMLLATAFSVYAVTNTALCALYRRYIIAFFIMLAIPSFSELLGKHVYYSLSWRWLWMIPFPVLVSVAVAGGFRVVRTYIGKAGAALAFLTVSVVFVAATPRLVVSTENYTKVGWPRFKLEGDSIFLLHQKKNAYVKDGRLFLDGEAEGY